MEARIEAGAARYDPEGFAACGEVFENLECLFRPLDHPACLGNSGIFVGTAQEFQPCATSSDCIPGLYCAGEEDACGICRQELEVGEDCSEGVCRADLACVAWAEGTYCSTIGVPGATCGTPETGFCDGRLQCVGSGDIGECREPAAVGEVCGDAATADCDTSLGTSCVGGICVEASVGDAGDVCGDATICSVTTTCTENEEGLRVCVLLPREGEPCTGNGRCHEDTYCDFATGVPTCLAEKPHGEPCDFDTECEGQLFCIGYPGRCDDLTLPVCE